VSDLLCLCSKDGLRVMLSTLNEVETQLASLPPTGRDRPSLEALLYKIQVGTLGSLGHS